MNEKYMAGHTNSSSHGHNMFWFGQYFCRAYRCFNPDKKPSAPNKHKQIANSKSIHRIKSFGEACQEINEARRDTDNTIYVRRSQRINEVRSYKDIPYSPRQNLNSKTIARNSSARVFSRSFNDLFRSANQKSPTKGQSRLMRSLSKQSDDIPKSNNEGLLKRSTSSNKLETKSLGRSSVPLTRSLSQKGSMESLSRKGFIETLHLDGLVKLLTIKQKVECTLEELCFGCVKKILVDRNVVTSNGQIIKELEMLSIKVKPGWTKGTTITFEGLKDDEKGTHSCAVNLVITEKEHKLYRREEDDLEFAVRISLLQALTGCTLSVPLLSGDKINLMLDDIIEPGCEKIIAGEGMRKLKQKKQRGNLRLTFLVDFPTELTDDQISEIVTILQDSS